MRFFIFCMILSIPALALEPSVEGVNKKSQSIAYSIAQWLGFKNQPQQDAVAYHLTTEKVAELSLSEQAKALLHGREEQGGNLLHFIARNKETDPHVIRRLDYMVDWWARSISVRVLSKALKHRDNEGLTPKELANKLQNEVAFKALTSAEIITNNRNTKNFTKVKFYGSPIAVLGSTDALIPAVGMPPEPALATAAVAAGVIFYCWKAFKKWEIK